MAKHNARTELAVEFVRETENAILVKDGNNEVWIPKSQVTYDEDLELKRGLALEIELPEWLAEEKGLI